MRNNISENQDIQAIDEEIESQIEENEDILTAFTNKVLDGTKAPKTKMLYSQKIKCFIKWLKSDYPSYCENNVLNQIIPIDIIKRFLAHISMKTDKQGKYLEPTQYNSSSLINSYISAIKWEYKSKGLNFSEDYATLLSEYACDYKREVASLKEAGEMKITEGTQPMSFRGYEYLAEKALKMKNDFSLQLLVHTFLLFSWNLMARSITTSSIVYDCVTWEDDALVVNFGKLKNDQEVVNQFPRHIYANPENPTICPILSFAIYIFCNNCNREDKSRCIFQKCQNRFSDWLKKICRNNRDEIESLGLLVGDIGTHSFRKGVATTLSNNPGGPDAVSIWLRAGWSLGSVQSRYIFQCSGGDQFVGRAATGLDINDFKFAALPPHFNDKDGVILTPEEWEEILPGYESFYPTLFKSTLPFLLASLVYHQNFLIQTLPTNHVLFQQRVWRNGYIEKLKPKVHCGYMINEVTGLRATGIPPSVTIYSKIKHIEQQLNDVQSKLTTQFQALSQNIREEIVNHFEMVNGVRSLTSGDVVRLIGDLETRITSKILSAINPDNSTQTNESENHNGTIKSWTWGGRIHPVPENFQIQHTNVKVLWDLWWEGNEGMGIGPYRFFKNFDFKSRSDQVILTKGRKVISNLISLTYQSADSIAQMNKIERDQLFQKVFQDFCLNFYSLKEGEDFNSKRVDELSFVTWYDRLISSGKRKRDEYENNIM